MPGRAVLLVAAAFSAHNNEVGAALRTTKYKPWIRFHVKRDEVIGPSIHGRPESLRTSCDSDASDRPANRSLRAHTNPGGRSPRVPGATKRTCGPDMLVEPPAHATFHE